jgi:hypothetical protein
LSHRAHDLGARIACWLVRLGVEHDDPAAGLRRNLSDTATHGPGSDDSD